MKMWTEFLWHRVRTSSSNKNNNNNTAGVFSQFFAQKALVLSCSTLCTWHTGTVLLWFSPANCHSADVSYSFICHPRYGQWTVRSRVSNTYIRPTARQAHNGISHTVSTSGTWLLYIHVQSYLHYDCARDPEDGGSTFLRNAGTNQIHANGCKNPKYDRHLNGSHDKPENQSYKAGHKVLN